MAAVRRAGEGGKRDILLSRMLRAYIWLVVRCPTRQAASGRETGQTRRLSLAADVRVCPLSQLTPSRFSASPPGQTRPGRTRAEWQVATDTSEWGGLKSQHATHRPPPSTGHRPRA